MSASAEGSKTEGAAKAEVRAEARLPAEEEATFGVVGIGASAGGLEAFSQLLGHLPAKTGLAFVLVQHLDPSHVSQLTELLGKATALPVVEVTEGMELRADHVYVIPPNVSMAISKRVLHLTPRSETTGQHLPLDVFFRSLAEEEESRAIGVILSGTGSDGSIGMAEIKAVGGITFAQDEKTARYSGMPLNAINSGCVDFVLPPEEIAKELVRIGRHPYFLLRKGIREGMSEGGTESGESFQQILAHLRAATGVDFEHYRETTIERRIARRMALHRQESIKEYLKFIEEHPAEIEVLYRDILINVTSFFRDSEVFEALKAVVFPEIVKSKSPENPIRIWVPGCSTGQEVYSLAIALLEFLDQSGMRVPIQIFGTDVNDAVAIERARAGLYAHTIEKEVSAARLQRFFSKEAGGYRIGKSIRDMCVFARQNVLADPPFSRLDLVSCRNVLIYLSGGLQKRIIPTFHYALNNGGYLLLGTAETVGRFTDLFTVVDQKHSIFAKAPTLARTYPFFVARDYPIKAEAAPGPAAGRAANVTDVQKEADRVVLGRYAPAGVLINEQMEILQFRGRTGPYLEPAPGEASYHLLRMARQSVFVELRRAVEEAKKQNATVRREGIVMRDEEGERSVSIEVVPIRAPGAQRCFLVLFEDVAGGEKAAAKARVPAAASAEGEVAGLQQELASTKEYLQAIIEQQSAANEELQSANEEILSSNEELQSTNEEMQTAKEELQSTNEELRTVNDELQSRNHEVGLLNDDLTNILGSVKIPIVMFGMNLRIRRFTPMAGEILHLRPTDVGRALGDLKMGIDCANLEEMLLKVIGTVAPQEREVTDREGHWHMMRLYPYRTTDHRIDGVVMVLLDVHAMRQAQEEVRDARDLALAIVDTVPDPLLILDKQLRVRSASRSFYRVFRVTSGEVEGHIVYDLGNGQWNSPQLRGALEDVLLKRISLVDFEVEHDFPEIGRRTMLLNARRLQRSRERAEMILLVFRDVTERKNTAELIKASAAKDHFMAVLSHELRTPLTPVLAATSALASDPHLPEGVREHVDMIRRNVEMEARLIDDLLDLTRITRGKVELHRQAVDLCAIVRRAVEVCRPNLDGRGLRLGLEIPEKAVYVDGDPARLQQIFWNLLGNAIKFTPAGGRIDLRCKVDDAGGIVRVEVQDTGIGIDSGLLPFVFHPFEQGEQKAARQFGGLGLGLTISKTLVEMHGGTIEAHSDGKGSGAMFRVCLPVLAGGPSGPEMPAAAKPRSAVQPLRILLVEDNADTAQVMARLLTAEGHKVRSAADVATALRFAAGESFDLLLSDLGLPDKSGFDLMRELRSQGLKLPGIALSGYGQEQDVRESLEVGFVRHLTKPVNLQQLQEAIATVGQV